MSLYLPELGAASHQAEQKEPTAASTHRVNPELGTALNGKHLHPPRPAKAKDCLEIPKGPSSAVRLQGCTESVKPLEGNLTSGCTKIFSTLAGGRAEGLLGKQEKVFWASPWNLTPLLGCLKIFIQQYV